MISKMHDYKKVNLFNLLLSIIENSGFKEVPF